MNTNETTTVRQNTTLTRQQQSTNQSSSQQTSTTDIGQPAPGPQGERARQWQSVMQRRDQERQQSGEFPFVAQPQSDYQRGVQEGMNDSPKMQHLAQMQQSADAHSQRQHPTGSMPAPHMPAPFQQQETEPLTENSTESVQETPVTGDAPNSPPPPLAPNNGDDQPEMPPTDLPTLQTTGEEESDGPVSDQIVEPLRQPLPSPEQDPNFQGLSESIEKEGDQQQQHRSSNHEVAKAQDASLEAPDHKQSIAQSHQVDDMNDQPTPSFDTAAFVTALMARIESVMPKNEEEADEFNDSHKMAQVKSNVVGSVESAQETSVGPLEQTTKQAPNLNGIPSKEVTPLPNAPIGRQPQDVGADRAVPQPVDSSQVEQPMENSSKELDQAFSSNNMTREQLSGSNEPGFQSALEQSQNAQEDSQNAPQQLRQDEQQTLSSGQQTAQNTSREQMDSIHQDRVSAMNSVHSTQETTSTQYTAEEQAVADHINQIYQRTKSDVEGRLDRLDTTVNSLFTEGERAARTRFEQHIDREMRLYKEERYAGVSGKIVWLYDAAAGLPDEVNKFFTEARKNYIAELRTVMENIAQVVAQELTAAKQRIQEGRQEVASYVGGLPEDLRKVGRQAASAIKAQFDALDSQVDAKQESLIETLADQYRDSVQAVDAQIEEMKAANRGLVDIALGALQEVASTIAELRSLLLGVIGAALDTISAILMDPIGFLSNLVEGVGQGLSNFLGNAQEHMTSGLVGWLTGAMSNVGIEMPDDLFSLQGIFDLTTQALGLTWDFVRDRAVTALGERPVRAMEESFEIFQVIREDGMAGAWEHIKEQFGDLKETIMGSITGIIISEAIEAGIKKILTLLMPAGAFVQAALMIVDVAKFIITDGAQIIELVRAFIDSISAIASGSVGAVAEKIEQALVLSVPVLIGAFTAILGIGDLAAKVRKVFEKIVGRVHDAIDAFIERARVWFSDRRGRRRARRDQRRGGDGERDERDTDSRSFQEKKNDLEAGIRQGTALLRDESISIKDVEEQLEAIRRRYNLKVLEFVKGGEDQYGEQLGYIHGEVNPKEESRKIPLGFKSFGHLKQFGTTLQAGLSRKGYRDTELFMQGSAVTGFSYDTGSPFDEGRISDFDVAIASPSILEKAVELELLQEGRQSSRPIETGSADAQVLGLERVLSRVSTLMGRPVNIMIFENKALAKAKARSIRIPTRKDGF